MFKTDAKILLVDDRKENLLALEALLADLGVTFFKAHSGHEALELALKNDFALAILDVQMPEMDGFELAELMRGVEKTRRIPIIFVTAATHSSNFVFKGYDSGAVDFLYKPLEPAVLKSKAKIFIQLYNDKKLLEAQKDAAETADRLKSEFLANISHEIRTPLNAILGFANLIKDENLLPQERNHYVDIISRSGHVLARVIDDILDLSKAEAGQIRIFPENFSPLEVLQNVVDDSKALAQAKGLKLEFETYGDVPNIFSDLGRARQILTNIIGNAIKFSENGAVKIILSFSKEQGKISYLVTDTGIGISEKDQLSLFHRFVQADGSMTRKFGGTGLGLLLSRKLAQALGGDVVLRSSHLGAGSTFEVTLSAKMSGNIEVPKEKQEAVLSDEQQKNLSFLPLRILLAEDSPDNHFLIKQYLKKSRVDLDWVENGDLAVKKALSQNYDVILMDIQMPVLDGFHATQKLRENHYVKPIIALTAHALPEDRKKCFEVGCDAFLAKPVSKDTLLGALNQYSNENLLKAIQ